MPASNCSRTSATTTAELTIPPHSLESNGEMDASAIAPRRASAPGFVELFTPKLVTVLREGYRFQDFRADAIAGLTVAIVALPLSLAIAIASGVEPERGLYTAIIGGFLVSALGGSRYQIGGPAGAFIVLIASIVQRHGYDGLVLATFIAGLIMMAVGFLRLGTYVKYIPYPVTVGFTAGIAVLIFASQIKELLGLTILNEPAPLLPKLGAAADALPGLNPAALVVTALALAIILAIRAYRPAWPAFLIAVLVTTLAASTLQLDVATIGSQFGGVPNVLPSPAFPVFTLEKVQAVLPDALAIALLGSIESLLSAVVADGMSGRRHRSNCELVAQGAANIASVMFGGIPVTGTIARTATNVRAGAKGPVSGMLHAAYLLLFMLAAAPLAAHIPLAALGVVLAVVAWNMAERHEFAALVRASSGDRAVVLTTFLLTIFYDLTLGISVGVVLGAFLFLHRMAEGMQIEGHSPLIAADQPDTAQAPPAFETRSGGGEDIMIYRLSGAFFFGATAKVTAVLDRLGQYPRVLVLDFSEVPFVDTTAAKSVHAFARKAAAYGTHILIVGAPRPVRRALLSAGLRKPLARYARTLEAGLQLLNAASRHGLSRRARNLKRADAVDSEMDELPRV